MNSRVPLISGLTVAVLAVALVLSGFGAALALGAGGENSSSTKTVTTTATNSSNSPFVLTLVIATDSIFNSSAGDQPAFFVLGQNGLQSSANISLPANRLIKLVIINYDDGNASLVVPGDNAVSGTTDGTVFVASNDNINSSQGAGTIDVKGGESVTSVPTDQLSHTFKVPSLNLNVPIPVSSTVVAYFTVHQAGSFTWLCETLCGDAAMSTKGWMTGSLVAS